MRPHRLALLAAISTLATGALIAACATGERGSRQPAAAEDIIRQQKDRALKRGGQKSIWELDGERNRVNGGRLPIGGPEKAGFWQMPPLPADHLDVGGRKLAMKMGALQASVLPSGKVLMVSGSSNRGDQRAPGSGPPVSSQVYNFIDNTELFNPALVPLPARGSLTVEPTVDASRLQALAQPLGRGGAALYERPHSLPDHLVFRDSPLDPDFGTVRDPKFCAKERPPGPQTTLFDNGVTTIKENGVHVTPEVYCSKVADPSLRGGRDVAPVLDETTGGPTEPNIDLFCGGHHPLPDGNVLFAGGTRKAISFPTENGQTNFQIPIPFHGIKRTLVFDWRQQRWTESSGSQAVVNMGDGRWYPSVVELSDGKMLIIGGMNHRGEISHTLEIFNPATRTMSQLVDFRPLGAPRCEERIKALQSQPTTVAQATALGRGFVDNQCIMSNEPFTYFDPRSQRRFDNYPRVFLTHSLPGGFGCNNPRTCMRLLITGDGSAEGNRDVEMRKTLFLDLDTSAFPRLRARFVPGPDRKGPTHLYPTTIFDPTTSSGDYLVMGGSLGTYDPKGVAQDANPFLSTDFNRKLNHRTVSWMHRFNSRGTWGQADPYARSGAWEPVNAAFLGADNDVTARIGMSKVSPGDRTRVNSSGMINPNAVLLPTRQFLVMGGGNHSYSDPIFHPVLFTPVGDPHVKPPAPPSTNPLTGATQVGSWFRNFMNPVHLPRLYHNTALLLPDGRVFMGSGNTFISFLKGVDQFGLPIVGPEGQKNSYNSFAGLPGDFFIDSPAEQYQVELFSPPYLFGENPRPVIEAMAFQAGQAFGAPHDYAPERANAGDPNLKWINPAREDVTTYGQQIQLRVSGVPTNAQGRVTFIRLGGVTHAFNFSQKLHSLVDVGSNSEIVTVRANGLVTVRTPASSTVAPPGYYMVFFVNATGQPSEARMVKLTL